MIMCVTLVKLLPRETTVNSVTYTETLRSLNAHLCPVCPTGKCWSVSPPWQHQATHKCMHHWGYHKTLMESATTPTLQSSPHIITFSPVWSFEKQSVRTPLCRWCGTAECHVPEAAEGGGKLLHWAGMYALVQRWKNTTDKDGDHIRNNFAFSNVVVRFLNFCMCNL